MGWLLKTSLRYCCSTWIHYKNTFEECFWMPKPYYAKIKIFVSNFKLRNMEFLEESNEYIYVILIEHKWFWQGIFLNSNINQLRWSNCYADLMQSMPPWNHLHFIDKQKSVLTITFFFFINKCENKLIYFFFLKIKLFYLNITSFWIYIVLIVIMYIVSLSPSQTNAYRHIIQTAILAL